MQQAVNRMRKAGYHGIISIPCIDYANACGKIDGSDYNGSTWLKSRPSDPDGQLIAEAHVYGKNLCDTVKCFDSSMKPITKVVPMIFGETGETYDASDCGSELHRDVHGLGRRARRRLRGVDVGYLGRLRRADQELPRYAVVRLGQVG